MFKSVEKLDGLFVPGSIIGLGESSHGSATENNWKHDLVLDYIKNGYDDNSAKKIIFYIEDYGDPIAKMQKAFQDSDLPIEEIVKENIGQLYKIHQTQEIYDLFVSIGKLIRNSKKESSTNSANIEICGVDFANAEAKGSTDQSEMLRIRNKIIFDNIKNSYQAGAVHFFSAHNTHVGRYIDTETKCEEVGKLLEKQFRNKYIPIAQHTSEGLIRAKKPDGSYDEIKFKFKDLPNSVTEMSTSLFKGAKEESVVLKMSDNTCAKLETMEQAGFFWPMKDPWLMPVGAVFFDYIILHKYSKAMRVLSL